MLDQGVCFPTLHQTLILTQPPFSATCRSRCVAVVVEGKDEALILELDWSTRKLSLKQTLDLAPLGIRFPCQAAFDSTGRLWVAGGPPLETSAAAHIGVAVAGA